MGWQTFVATVFQAGNRVVINPKGFFVYNGNPALGNLIAAIVPATTTDPYGNVALVGSYTYGANGNVLGMAANGAFPVILFSQGGNTHQTTNPQIFTNLFNGGASNEFEALVISSGASGHDGVLLEAFTQPADGTGAANFAIVIGGVTASVVTKTNYAIDVPLTATAGTAANPSVITNDAPTQATLINGWTNSGANANGLWYRLLPDKTVELVFDVVPPVGVVGNSVCFVLPTTHRPATSKNLGVIGWNNPQVNNSASLPWVFVGSNGNVQVTAIEVANIAMFGTFRCPLW